MSVIRNNLLLAGDDTYNLQRSLRFRSSASAYLNRTPASAGNRQTWTWSGWVKRGKLEVIRLFSGGTSASNETTIYFENDKLGFVSWIGGLDCRLVTTQVFRDPSSWYHIVLAFDSTQATSSNRIKLYINGSQVTAFDTATYPNQNYQSVVNSSTGHFFSSFDSSYHFDGYLTEVNLIDGQALTPSSFGETSAKTGVWQPKKYSGTYGTNGFYLPFSDNSALTSGSNAGLGKDFSGNGNYWNTNNISITSGVTYDSMTDVPTLTSATASNFATLNPLFVKGTTPVISNGNMKITGNGNYGYVGSTMSLDSGKWYWEAKMTAGAVALNLGIITTQYPNTDFTGTGAVAFNGARYYCNEAGSYSYNASQPSFTVGDTIGMTFDSSTGEFKFNVNNGSFHTVATKTPDGRSWFPAGDVYASGDQWDFNFGQRPFAYTPPTGFKALNTYNLPTPTIGATPSSLANKYFDAILYTGNGSSQSISSLNFATDLVWVKNRSVVSDHILADTVRGANLNLKSNTFGSEDGTSTFITAFGSNGFSVGSDSRVNGNGNSLVAWNWKANGSGSTNTAGSITSTVSANTSAGFSVVTYTGTGTNGATVGHGLGVAPSMIIVKHRNDADGWMVYHSKVNGGSSPQNYFLQINNTNAQAASSQAWNNTAPSSSVITLGTYSNVNISGGTYVAYCFAEVAGYSKFGSYTGNGSSDGTFVYTGFRPKFIMVKRSDSTNFWLMMDTSRYTYNVMGEGLLANASDAAFSWNPSKDILSNGFKVRTSDSAENANGGTYIYMAFAESPFKYSLAR